jgi:TPR repeat protein
MRAIVPCGLLIALAMMPARADYVSGVEAWERGDYETAARDWQPLAEAGHADSQYRLGRLYYYGEGVAQDFARAAEWYRRAAEQGHARAQGNLGLLYETGRGVARDDALAARWYRASAEQGRTFAQYRLGRLCETGRGVERDDAEAARLYEAAARDGYAEAQVALARMYEEGRGVERSASKARKWRKRAAREGATVATSAAEPDLDDVADIPQEPAPAAAEQAWARGDYVEAFRALEPAAEAGDPEAQYRLAGLIRAGHGTTADPALAASWYEKAAVQGHGLAMYEIAFLYMRGADGVRTDLPRAWVWFARAADAAVGDAASWRDRVNARMSPRERERAGALYGTK